MQRPKKWVDIPEPFLSKCVPEETDERSKRIAVFSMWPMPRCYKQGTRSGHRHFKIKSSGQ
jgi:hypothetical protein